MARKKGKQKKTEAAVSKDGERIVLATNRRAFRNYVIDIKVEAGLVLLGSEVKSLRLQTPTIAEGYARMRGEELFVEGINILPLQQASYRNHEPTRSRKCLLHKKELRKVKTLLEAQGATMVPLQLYFKGPYVKIELGIGKGRRKGDKREYEKAKSAKREIREAKR